MKRLIRIFEKLFLLNIFIFILFFYHSKLVVKVALATGMFFFISINILRIFSAPSKATPQSYFSSLISKNPLNIPVLVFLISAVTSTIFSLNFSHSQRHLFERVIPYALFFILGSFFIQADRSRKRLIILIIFFIFSGLIICINGAIDFFRFPTAKRLYLLFGTPFNFTPFLLFYVPLTCLIAFFAKNKLLKILGLISFFIFFPCLFWNNSRAAWSAVPIAILAVSFLKNKKAVLILLLIFSISFLFLSPAIKNRVTTTFDTLTWGGRVELYKSAIKIYKDFPVFGAGLGMYEKLIYLDKYKSLKDNLNHLHAHNTYLEIAADMGLVGFMSFLAIFIVFFINLLKKQRLWKNYSEDKQAILLGLSAAVLATLITAFAATIITVGVQDPAIFWFFLGVAAGLFREDKT